MILGEGGGFKGDELVKVITFHNSGHFFLGKFN